VNFEDNRKKIKHNNYHNYQPIDDANGHKNHLKNYSPLHCNDNKINNNHNIEQSHQCKHCNNFNHTSIKCRRKLTCNLRNKKYHNTNDCYLKNNDLKTDQTSPKNRLNEPIGN